MREGFHPVRVSSIILLQQVQVNVPSMIHMQEVISDPLVSMMLSLHTATASRYSQFHAPLSLHSLNTLNTSLQLLPLNTPI